MTQEQIKAKAKEYFPNDEFKQQIVIDAINWATKELQKENTELKVFKEKCKFNVSDIFKDIETENNLTKAKEIIRELLTCARNYPESNKQKMQKAEQFLRDCDIDNAIQQANEGLDLDKIADEMERDLKDSEVEK